MATASNDFDGRADSPVCIVTGGASGMGLAVLQHLVSLQWKVTVVDYNEALGREVTGPMGDQVMFIKANVADYEELCTVYSQTWKKWKRLDAVFANAVWIKLNVLIQ
jgi:NAD(P)-dependent dehydrogenase (short-subunit alcohol dehydrogenase family)